MTFYTKTEEELLESGRQRIEKYVEKRAPYQCWPWTGASFKPGGYGQIKIARRSRGAHIVTYEMKVGPVPEGAFVLHRCDNRICCNPAHLYLGDHEQNMIDRSERFRQQHHEKHWKARLSERDVYLIREKWASGVPGTALAKQFGVRQSHVSRIVLRKEWATR